MSEFRAYLEFGFHHILDLQAYDHLLFITVLCALYRLAQWKSILVIVTAFTIGHSITLAMVSLEIIEVDRSLIEFLIPCTILSTCLYNFYAFTSKVRKGRLRFNYVLALLFGFIHGMGFSSYFKALLGSADEVLLPLFSFNLGIELGQIIIVMILSLISSLLLKIKGFKFAYWLYGVSSLGALLSIMLMLDTWPW